MLHTIKSQIQGKTEITFMNTERLRRLRPHRSVLRDVLKKPEVCWGGGTVVKALTMQAKRAELRSPEPT